VEGDKTGPEISDRHVKSCSCFSMDRRQNKVIIILVVSAQRVETGWDTNIKVK